MSTSWVDFPLLKTTTTEKIKPAIVVALAMIVMHAKAQYWQTGRTAVPDPEPKLPVASARMQKPNIILILADDVGYKSLTCNEGNLYSTPNIDSSLKAECALHNAGQLPYARHPVLCCLRENIIFEIIEAMVSWEEIKKLSVI